MSTVPTFIHLRMHSEYSVSDGIVRIDGAVEKAVADNMPALALTDLSNLFGMVKFYERTRSRGVKPIIGCEEYVAPGDIDDEDAHTKKVKGGGGYHLVLLAKNQLGYKNLIKLVSTGYEFRPTSLENGIRLYVDWYLKNNG